MNVTVNPKRHPSDGRTRMAWSASGSAGRKEHPALTSDIETGAQLVPGAQPRWVDTARVTELYQQLLIELGEDPGRDAPPDGTWPGSK